MGPRGSTPPGSTPNHQTPAKMEKTDDIMVFEIIFVCVRMTLN